MTQVVIGGGGGGGGISASQAESFSTWILTGSAIGAEGIQLTTPPDTHIRTMWEVLDQNGDLFHTSYKPTAAEAVIEARGALEELREGWDLIERHGHRSGRHYVRLTAVRRRTITTTTAVDEMQRVSDIDGSAR
jgi:hypothetical protein